MKNVMCGGAALVLLMAEAANGAEFTVSGSISYANPSLYVIDQYDVTGPLSLGREVHHDAPGVQDFHAQANSLAEQYGLHAHAYNQIIHQVSGQDGGGTYASDAFAKSSFRDFVITGPAGATTVQTAINFHLSGQQGLEWYVPSQGNGSGVTSTVGFFMQINGSDNDGGFHTVYAENGIPAAPYESGMLVGFNGNMDLKTKVFTLPVNTPIPIALYLNTHSDVSINFADSFRTSANTDFSETLTFATDKPVFDLPSGYTVNSVEAGIVDNMIKPVGDNRPPVVSRVTVTPNPVLANTNAILSATVDDSTTGNSNIASAEYNVDGGTTWTPMSPADGTFNSPTEQAKATLTFSQYGVHTVCVRGTDVSSNTSSGGECITVTVEAVTVGCDLNANGRFDLIDVLRFVVGCRTGKASWLCDYNNDGRFTLRDTVLFVKQCRPGIGDQEANQMANQGMK